MCVCISYATSIEHMCISHSLTACVYVRECMSMNVHFSANLNIVCCDAHIKLIQLRKVDLFCPFAHVQLQ